MIAKALNANNINVVHFHITNSQLSSSGFTYVLVCCSDLWKIFCSLQSHICEGCKRPWEERTVLRAHIHTKTHTLQRSIKKPKLEEKGQNEGKRLRKPFVLAHFSRRVINLNFNTSNNSAWKRKKSLKRWREGRSSCLRNIQDISWCSRSAWLSGSPETGLNGSLQPIHT